MKLTDKETIENSKRLWAWCAETGGDKRFWPEWEKYGKIQGDCFFCEQASGFCHNCLYFKVFWLCDINGSPYSKSRYAETLADKKKYAAEVLKQIEEMEG